MALHNYKIDIKLDLVFTILLPFLQITNIDKLMIMNSIFKSP